MSGKKLQLHSLVIHKEDVERTKVYVYRLPNALRKLFKRFNRDTIPSVSWSTNTLWKVAVLQFPGILYAADLRDIKPNVIPEGKDVIWIISLYPIDVELLKMKTIEWLRREFEELMASELEFDFGECWKIEECVNLSEMFSENLMYRILPKLFGYHLAEKPLTFDCLNRSLEFSIVMSNARDTELISQPIYLRKTAMNDSCEVLSEPEENTEKFIVPEPFSYYISIGCRKPIDVNPDTYILNFSIHIHVWSVKAFMDKNEGINYVTGQESTSVYLYRPGDYYDNNVKVFQKIAVKRYNDWDKNENDEKTRHLIRYTEKADRYFCENEGIDINAAFLQPCTERKTNDGSTVLILHKNKHHPTLTKMGAGLPERHEIWKRVCERFPMVMSRKPLDEVRAIKHSTTLEFGKTSLPEKLVLNTEFSKSAKMFKEPLLYSGVYKRVILHVAIGDSSIRRMVLEILSIYLGVNLEYQSILTNGVTFEIEYMSNSFARELLKDDTDSRVEEIRNTFSGLDRSSIHLALIDLLDYSKRYSAGEGGIVNREKDPKQLLRHELARMNIVTQFIDCNRDEKGIGKKGSKKKNVKHEERNSGKTCFQDSGFIAKIQNALLDLLSAAGFHLPYLYKDKAFSSFSDECIAALGTISDSDNGFIVAMCQIYRGWVRYKIFNGPDKWMEMNELISCINREMLKKVDLKEKNSNSTNDSLQRWVLENLNDLIQNYPHITMYMNAALRRRIKVLSNVNYPMIFEKIHVLDSKRVTFIRMEVDNEIPAGEVVVSGKNVNREKGLFHEQKADNNMTYYIMPQRTTNGKQPVLTLTKIQSPDTRIFLQRIQQYDILTHNGKDAEKYAVLSNVLIQQALTASPEVTSPLPMKMLGHLSEYFVACGEVL